MYSITTFLGNILNKFMAIKSFRLGGFEDQVNSAFSGGGAGNQQGYTAEGEKHSREFWVDMATKLAKIADWLVPTIMIIIGMVGAIYMTVIGIKYAKAEGEEQKNEAKKKLINAGVGIGIALLIMLVMFLILNNANAIANFIKGK